MLKRFLPGLAFAAIAAAQLHAATQPQPQRPVRLVVPFPAGGSTDVVARLMAARLSEAWRQPVTIENMAGNASISGTHFVASSRPDGHTLLAVNAALAMNEALSRRLPYHALRSFAPVSLLAHQQLLLVVPAASRFSTVDELVAAGRAGASPLAYASSGTGSLSHLAGELLNLMSGASYTHAPQKGARQALDQLAGRHLSYAIVPLPRALPYLQDGRLRAIAVTGVNRAAALPDLPTVGASIAGYGVSTWIGLLAPYGASVQLIRRVNADVQTIMRGDTLVEHLAGLGYEVDASTPGDFQNRLRADIERYTRIALDAGIGVQ